MCMFCSFCPFSFDHCVFCFLFFFDLRILITPLIFSNSSCFRACSVHSNFVQRHRACCFLSHLLQRQHPLNINVLSHRYLNNCLTLYLRTKHNRISTHSWNLYCHLRIYICIKLNMFKIYIYNKSLTKV